MSIAKEIGNLRDGLSLGDLVIDSNGKVYKIESMDGSKRPRRGRFVMKRVLDQKVEYMSSKVVNKMNLLQKGG